MDNRIKCGKRFQEMYFKELRTIERILDDDGCTREQAAKMREDAWNKVMNQHCRWYEIGNEIQAELGKRGLIVMDEEKLDSKWCFISFRPETQKPEDFKEFMDGIMKFCKRKWILQWYAAFEQTGENEDELGKGYHAHILAEVNRYVQVQEILRGWKNDYRKTCNVKIGNEDYKFLRYKRDLEYCRNYIHGIKHNETKEAAVEMNPLWRAKWEIHDLYSSQPRTEGLGE